MNWSQLMKGIQRKFQFISDCLDKNLVQNEMGKIRQMMLVAMYTNQIIEIGNEVLDKDQLFVITTTIINNKHTRTKKNLQIKNYKSLRLGKDFMMITIKLTI